MRKTLKQKIDESLLEMQEHQKRHDKLMAQYNDQQDKARTHRLCKRGGYVEKELPGLITLSDKQFYTYVEKVMQSQFANRILAELNAENETSAKPQDGDATAHGGGKTASIPTQSPAQTNPAHAQKPAEAPHNGGGNSNAHGSNNAGATS